MGGKSERRAKKEPGVKQGFSRLGCIFRIPWGISFKYQGLGPTLRDSNLISLEWAQIFKNFPGDFNVEPRSIILI